MTGPKLTKLELQIMEALWSRGEASIREIQEAFPEKRQTRLHHHPDHGVPPGSQEGRAPRQESRKLPHFRGRGLARCRAAEIDRRSSGPVRRAHATRDGAPDRIRQTHAGGCKGSRENPPQAGEKGQSHNDPEIFVRCGKPRPRVGQSLMAVDAIRRRCRTC